MERFIHRENLEHYRRLLAQSANGEQRQQILKLLAEEEEDERPAAAETGIDRLSSRLLFSFWTHRHNVADNPTAPALVRYWSNSGQR